MSGKPTIVIRFEGKPGPLSLQTLSPTPHAETSRSVCPSDGLVPCGLLLCSEDGGESVSGPALLARDRIPAVPPVIFHHGMVVGLHGLSGASERRYSLESFCHALAGDGYLASLPVRRLRTPGPSWRWMTGGTAGATPTAVRVRRAPTDCFSGRPYWSAVRAFLDKYVKSSEDFSFRFDSDS